MSELKKGIFLVRKLMEYSLVMSHQQHLFGKDPPIGQERRAGLKLHVIKALLRS